MSNPFDPKQLEAQARAFSEKVISGISSTIQSATGQSSGSSEQSANNDNASGFSRQIESMRAELQGLIESQVQQFLGKMDVVTREDYEIQRAMLAQALHRIDALEKEIETINARIDGLESK